MTTDISLVVFVVLNDLALCYQAQHQYTEAERLYVRRLSLPNDCVHSDQRGVLTG